LSFRRYFRGNRRQALRALDSLPIGNHLKLAPEGHRFFARSTENSGGTTYKRSPP
jgi:hypothetical protein